LELYFNIRRTAPAIVALKTAERKEEFTAWSR
jgi:hypothetical protein